MKDNRWDLVKLCAGYVLLAKLGWFYKAHMAYPSIPACSSDSM